MSNVISYVALRTLHRPLVKKKITSTLRRLTCANNAQGKISCHGHDPCACVLTMRGPSAADPLRAQIAKRRCAFMDGHCLEYGSKESRDRWNQRKVGRLPCNRIVPVTSFRVNDEYTYCSYADTSLVKPVGICKFLRRSHSSNLCRIDTTTSWFVLRDVILDRRSLIKIVYLASQTNNVLFALGLSENKIREMFLLVELRSLT